MGGDVPYPHGFVIRTCEEEEGGTSTTTAKYTTGIKFNNIKSHTINHELKFGSNNVAIADNSTTVVIFIIKCTIDIERITASARHARNGGKTSSNTLQASATSPDAKYFPIPSNAPEVTVLVWPLSSASC